MFTRSFSYTIMFHIDCLYNFAAFMRDIKALYTRYEQANKNNLFGALSLL